jgi:predicted GIY-YIG superfamily endonuclease
MPFYLYDLVIGRRIVYVGLTLNPKKRESQHRQRKWAPGFRMRIVAEFPDMFTAIAAEDARIAEKSPRLNTLGRRDKKRPKNGPHKKWDRALAEKMLREGAKNVDVAVAVGVSPHTLIVNFPHYMRNMWKIEALELRQSQQQAARD